MLVNLTPNLEEIERRKQIAIEENFEYMPQIDPRLFIEQGIYQSNFAFNFSKDEFIEKLDDYNYNERYYQKNKKEDETLLQFYFCEDSIAKYIDMYGVADNVEQIKEFYKEQIEDTKRKFVISITPVYQEKENKGKGGGWRWHKWGEYIGKLDSQCEYLDDEEFGDDFEYVLCFYLYEVLEEEE